MPSSAQNAEALWLELVQHAADRARFEIDDHPTLTARELVAFVLADLLTRRAADLSALMDWPTVAARDFTEERGWLARVRLLETEAVEAFGNDCEGDEARRAWLATRTWRGLTPRQLARDSVEGLLIARYLLPHRLPSVA